MDALRGAERLVIDTDEGRLVLAHGRVLLDDADLDNTDTGSLELDPVEAPDLSVPPARAEADELMLIHRWLQKARNVQCHDAVGVVAFAPSGGRPLRRRRPKTDAAGVPFGPPRVSDGLRAARRRAMP